MDAHNEGAGCGFFYACEDFGRLFDHSLIIIIIMLIFKRLSLTALSALQDHEGGGGDEVIKIITQMFFSDSA